MKRSYGRFLVSLLIGLGLLYYTFQFIDVQETLLAIRQAKLGSLGIALSLIVIAYGIRGRRWMIWEQSLKYWDSLELILIGFMGNNLLPARLGEILRAHCTASKTDKNFGRTAALASVAIERILDGFTLAVFGLLGLFLVSIGPRLEWGVFLICALFGFLALGLVLSIYFHEQIRAFLEKINRIFPGHLTRVGKAKVNYFLDGLLLLRKLIKMLYALFTSVLVWGVELAAYFFIANTIYAPVPVGKCLLFLVVVNFASLFPFTIGGIGAIEGVASAYLVSAGIPAEKALAMVLIQHSFQFVLTTVFGVVFYFTGKYYALPLIQPDASQRNAQKETTCIRQGILGDAQKVLSQLSAELGIEKKSPDRVQISIVIPAYNEEARLPKTVLSTIRWCNLYTPSYEALIVDDGSIDGTLEVARMFSDYDKNVRVLACPHLGKGGAVRMGMLNATGNYILFMDSDGATPLDEIFKLIKKLNEGYPIAIGSRVDQTPGETVVQAALHRKIIGRTFAAIVNVFGVSGIADTQCGFKMFKREVVKDLFSLQKINGFAFDVEILYLARKFSLPIAEVPVNWVDQKGSKVNLITDSIRMLHDVLRIPIIHRNTLPSEAISMVSLK